MAAALLRRYLSDADRQGMSIASAGLHAEAGRGADARAIAVAREFGISLEDHRTEPVTAERVAHADLILVMDYKNEAELLALYPAAQLKVFLITTFAGKAQSKDSEIPDPFMGDSGDVRRCYETLHYCVYRLASALTLATGARTGR